MALRQLNTWLFIRIESNEHYKDSQAVKRVHNARIHVLFEKCDIIGRRWCEHLPVILRADQSKRLSSLSFIALAETLFYIYSVFRENVWNVSCYSFLKIRWAFRSPQVIDYRDEFLIWIDLWADLMVLPRAFHLLSTPGRRRLQRRSLASRGEWSRSRLACRHSETKRPRLSDAIYWLKISKNGYFDFSAVGRGLVELGVENERVWTIGLAFDGERDFVRVSVAWVLDARLHDPTSRPFLLRDACFLNRPFNFQQSVQINKLPTGCRHDLVEILLVRIDQLELASRHFSQ